MHVHRIWHHCALALFIILLLPLSALAQAPTLPNPNFDQGVDPATSLPVGWSLFSGDPGVHLKLVEGASDEHSPFFAIHDSSTSAGYGIRSALLPAEPGVAYQATASISTGNGGRAYLYLDFLDETGDRIRAQSDSSSSTKWSRLTVTSTAPEGTRHVSIILYSTSTVTGVAQFAEITLERIDAKRWSEEVTDKDVSNDQLDYAPQDGSVVTSNPPSFVWIPVGGAHAYTLEYSPDPTFPEASTTRVEDIDLSIFTPPATLDAAQTWYWRLFALDANDNMSPPSKVRAFRVSPTAVNAPLPDLVAVRDRIPQQHPRLFFTPETLDDVRTARRSNMLLRLLADSIIRDARSMVYRPLPEEPPHTRPNGVWDVNLWREYRITVQATDTMTTLAFAYLLTGDATFGDAARKLMLHIASWDPAGATSAAVNDESSMPILYQMSRAYTWMYDHLSPEDRQIIQDVMRIRANEAYRILKNRPFESRPYGSHAGRSLGFLGEAAIAFLGEIPEADEWFDYVTRIFYSIYPAWGKDAGGWAEGHAYWTSYMNRVLWFVDSLKVATGLDLYQKSFFQNTGMFKVYTHPPYTEMGPFGDFADRGPSSSDGNVMSHFAGVYNNPYYKWYADEVGAIAESGVMGFIRAFLYPRSHIKGMAPTDLNDSAHFPDVGWVVFHKDFGVEEDSIQFMFKSSPYGSFSHSLADQNTFTLEAYGEPLAISSGYRPWYGSRHHMEWTKTTQAQNGLLISGEGQITQSLSAKGAITHFLHGRSFDFTEGDATAAYGDKLDQYARSVVYVRPDVFVVYDDVRAKEAETFSWLLHAYHPFTLGEALGQVRIEAPNANLELQLWASEEFDVTQTNKFAVPLDEPMDKPTQWHLTASTQTPSRAAAFLAVMVPSKTDTPRFITPERIHVDGGDGVQITDESGETTILFAQSLQSISSEGLSISGEVGAWNASHRDGKRLEGLLLVGGTHLATQSGLRFEASASVDTEVSISYVEADGVIIEGSLSASDGPDAEMIHASLHIPGEPKISRVQSTHEILEWSYTDGVLDIKLVPGTHELLIR